MIDHFVNDEWGNSWLPVIQAAMRDAPDDSEEFHFYVEAALRAAYPELSGTDIAKMLLKATMYTFVKEVEKLMDAVEEKRKLLDKKPPPDE